MSSISKLNINFLKNEFTWALNALQPNIDLQKRDELFQEIIEQYSQSNRYYHNLQHIQFCIETLNTNKQKNKAICRNHLKLAIFYHDFYYDVDRKDNELQSAAYTYKALLSCEFNHSDCEFISNLILKTKPNIYLNDDNLSDDLNLNFSIISDLDLASFSVDFEYFKQDSINIFKEVQHKISYTDFIEKRIKFLQSYNNRLIYYTNIIHVRKEKIAHTNMQKYINENVNKY